jgi:hypothetical protein
MALTRQGSHGGLPLQALPSPQAGKGPAQVGEGLGWM